MTTRRQEATAIVDQENYYMYVLMLTSGNVSKVAVRNHPLAIYIYMKFHVSMIHLDPDRLDMCLNCGQLGCWKAPRP